MKKQTQDFTLRVRVDENLRNWLADYAQRNHTTMSGIVKMLLNQEQKKDVNAQPLGAAPLNDGHAAINNISSVLEQNR